MTPSLDCINIEKNVENGLYAKIAEIRSRNKLGFQKDNILSSILSTALANYEVERVTGLTFCE